MGKMITIKKGAAMKKLTPISFCLQKLDGNIHQIYIYDDITKYGDFNWETWEYD